MSTNESDPSLSVLLSFRAENVRSFRDELHLSLLAKPMAEPQYVRQIRWRQGGSPRSVLCASGVFGANASGKSNLLEAMDDMRHHVLHSFRSGAPGGRIPRWPFRLDQQSIGEPSRYEVDIVLDGVQHEYGYVIEDERVVEEWAYHRPKGRSAMLFHRESDTVEFGAIDKARSRASRDILRSNALYLSTAATAAHPQLTPLRDWFAHNMSYAHAASRPWRQVLTAEMLDEDRSRRDVLELLWAADLGIADAKKRLPDPVMQERWQRALQILDGSEDEPLDSGRLEMEELASVNLIHSGSSRDVEFEANEESLGTLVWFGLVGPVLQVLATGSVLLVDELDVSLHPDLVRRIVQLFQERETNPKAAQLVFNSHDPALMGDSAGGRLLGRDQIWFTEKLNDGRTQLFPLAELGPRKNEAVAKRYMEGRYGARPILLDSGFGNAVEQAAVRSS
ncbi:MAG: ATP-binding protein [Acidimicrobiaceae bacterium]|nr:ATP-binding protein [Acidimicrobiia bacterium]MCY4492870.1 ATP-binding protein [Acidimicrobiaceae bacterium]